MLKASSHRSVTVLPFRFWGQYAHLTVPANRPELIGKAILQGTTPTARLMVAARATAGDLADALRLDESTVRALLDGPRPAPVVVIDAEDGLPPGEKAADLAIEDVVEALVATRPRRLAGPLIAYRMPAIGEGGLNNLRGLVERIAEHGSAGALDAVVIPKVEAAADVDAVAALLAQSEYVAAMPVEGPRLMVQIESAAGLAALATVVRSGTRLGSLIFGAVDFAADLGLPSVELDQPVLQHARSSILEAAAIARIPAIDGMTLAYPVLDPDLEPAVSRSRWLDRMALVYADARSAFAAGMSGKWVGHPAQLFAVTLARAATLPDTLLERAAAQLVGYREALENDRGVAIVEGQMADRATARHARELLRRATAAGLFDPRRAVALGVAAQEELAE